DVLLELRDRRAVDGPVARIVNARGDLVDQYCCVPALADDKHFHRKHADIVKGFRDAGCDLPRLACERRGHFRGHARDFENMIAMLVFRRLEAFHVAVTRTGDDYRNLSLEIDEAFQDTRRIAYRPPGCDSITTFGDLRLALAVVTELARFEHRRQADSFHALRQLRCAMNGRIRRGRNLQRADKILFDQSILGGLQHSRVGQNWPSASQERGGFRRYVLEFIGDDLDGT